MAPRIRETYSVLRRGSYLSAIDHFSRTLGHADLLAVYNSKANAGRLAILIDDGNVGDVQGRFLVDDASFLSLGLALVTLHHVNATHNGPIFLRQNLDYFAGTALVLTGQYDNVVAFTNFLHRIRSLQYFRSQRDDLHVVLGAKFARNRSEDTGADGLFLVVDKNGCVIIETDDAAVSATDVLGGANDNRLHHIALLDAAARNSFLDGNDNNVANRSIFALRAAQHLDAHDTTCAGIIRHVEVCLHLNHVRSPSCCYRNGWANSPE
ncbi:hypothetical protein AGR1C_Cc40458 [Agrobacterium fabacearum TT111]|nr:hypothetical protein AGR1C_Cc40458 [Agrobacterium fabacearum TT111]